jgi:hypothetical protein
MERIEKEEQAKNLIKYQNINSQERARQQQYPVTFVTYTISKPRKTSK